MNIVKKLSILFIIVAVLFSSNFLIISTAQAQSNTDLKNYLSYFYNRYSTHFDNNGMIFKTPGYGIDEFKKPSTAREILSLATYYKYRALQGDTKVRNIIKQAILDATQEMNSRSYNTQSFSDAWVQMDIISLIDQIPFLLGEDIENKIYQDILARAKSGILAPDSSNRAALSAVYWQQIINNLYNKGLIKASQKKEFDKLIYIKIKKVLDSEITKDGYYEEGRPKKFNPHYHLITAFAFASYSDITGNIEFYLVAKKMITNLRLLSFPNGMIEARIGRRPIGLGAQFYLGLGLLSYKFKYKDYSVYLNYANADRFFADPTYPDRLEYHSTIYNSSPNYHDDISFSNLAELALLTPTLTNIHINIDQSTLDNASTIIEFNNLIIKQIDSIYSTITYISELENSSINIIKPTLNIQNTYNQKRLKPTQENIQFDIFSSKLKKYFKDISFISPTSLSTLAGAYIYGEYTIEEIIDTLKNGPRAVHPAITAKTWRSSYNYQQYLASSD